jgi:tetratricopeptide (TPR) repeat protein
MLYGILFIAKGDGLKAIKILRKAIKDLEESQTMMFVGVAWAYLGYAHWLTGDYRTALEFSEKGLKITSDLDLPLFRSWFHCSCSLAHFGLGNLKEAGFQAEQALKCSLANNEKQFQGRSRILLGRVLAKIDPGQIEAAAGHLQQGISLLEELGILPWSGWGYIWLGEVYAESGRKEDALMNLKKAETMFREMGMDYWLAKAQEALARL